MEPAIVALTVLGGLLALPMALVLWRATLGFAVVAAGMAWPSGRPFWETFWWAYAGMWVLWLVVWFKDA